MIIRRVISYLGFGSKSKSNSRNTYQQNYQRNNQNEEKIEFMRQERERAKQEFQKEVGKTKVDFVPEKENESVNHKGDYVDFKEID